VGGGVSPTLVVKGGLDQHIRLLARVHPIIPGLILLHEARIKA
jgi:hypothetical protein